MTFGSQLFISSCLSHWKGSQDGQPFPGGKLLAVLSILGCEKEAQLSSFFFQLTKSDETPEQFVTEILREESPTSMADPVLRHLTRNKHLYNFNLGCLLSASKAPRHTEITE